jgi:MAF protein
MNLPLILASSSKARQKQLQQWAIPFKSLEPNINEQRLSDESAQDMVCRLARQKAEAVIPKAKKHIIIGCDQVMLLKEKIYGKPMTVDNAKIMLHELSGQDTVFLNGLCILNSVTQNFDVQLIPTHVRFKVLSEERIDNYIKQANPLHCAAAIKVECLGIFLIEKIESPDPFAVVGLPLFTLAKMLENAGFDWQSPKL